MGVRLIVEVLDAAPDALTYRERYVLLVLAENARDSTRLCWPGVEDDPAIIRRLRMGRSQRYGAIKALVDKGALERVQRGQKHVRAVYGIPRFTSQRPETPDAEKPSQRPENPDAEDPQRPGFAVSASGFSGLSVRETRTPSPQSPQSSSSPHARAARMLADAGASEDEARRALELVATRYKPRDVSSYLRRVESNGGLPDLVAEARADLAAAGRERDRAALRDALERAIRDGPHCEHAPGGAYIRPDTGLPHCPLCRRRARERAGGTP